jgi:hypothetical protein
MTAICATSFARLLDGLALNQNGGYGRRTSDMNQSQLHVIAWPGAPLPLPDTYRVKSRLREDGVIVPCPQGRYGHDWKEEAVALDGETYLRLAAVDLDDPEAIFAFVTKYGVLGGGWAYLEIMKTAPFTFANMYRPQLDHALEHEMKNRALRAEQTRMNSDSVWPSDTLKFHYTETLDEFRFAARCLRDLTAAWRMFKEGTSASDIQWESPQHSAELEFLKEDGFPLFLLSEMLPRWFLSAFTPRLTFHWTPPLPPGPAYSHLPLRQGGIKVDPERRPAAGELYNICALELYNHIVENANYLICGNENCQQKNFVHQQGRKKNWHRSSGVLYCSPSCAHAVAQRKYMRERKSRGSGKS